MAYFLFYFIPLIRTFLFLNYFFLYGCLYPFSFLSQVYVCLWIHYNLCRSFFYLVLVLMCICNLFLPGWVKLKQLCNWLHGVLVVVFSPFLFLKSLVSWQRYWGAMFIAPSFQNNLRTTAISFWNLVVICSVLDFFKLGVRVLGWQVCATILISSLLSIILFGVGGYDYPSLCSLV